MLHSSIVIDADKTSALGYSFIKAWQRDEELPKRQQRKYQELPIEQKESNKWIEATKQSSELLHNAQKRTIVADRESDIYDLLAGDFGEATYLLLRSSCNRKLANGTKLTEHLNNLPIAHQYELEIQGDVRKGIVKRTAKMTLKWDKVALVKPHSCLNQTLPSTKEVYVVEAKEQKAKGILWRIYTTHAVTNIEEAMQIIHWYKQRWYIEQVHRLLKTDGFKIERSQLEQGWAIRKLTLLAMMATLRIIQMMLAYQDDTESQLLTEVFNEDEIHFMREMNKKLEGATEKLKNKSNPQSLKWATWIIARIGGWKGYASQRKPGPIVLQKGLAKFYLMLDGWMAFKNYQKNVSTQTKRL